MIGKFVFSSDAQVLCVTYATYFFSRRFSNTNTKSFAAAVANFFQHQYKMHVISNWRVSASWIIWDDEKLQTKYLCYTYSTILCSLIDAAADASCALKSLFSPTSCEVNSVPLRLRLRRLSGWITQAVIQDSAICSCYLLIISSFLNSSKFLVQAPRQILTEPRGLQTSDDLTACINGVVWHPFCT